MTLSIGKWNGRGTLLHEGRSRGDAISVQFEVNDTDSGMAVDGVLVHDLDGHKHTFTVLIEPDDHGTFSVTAGYHRWTLSGTGKLSSRPSLSLLASNDNSIHAALALFDIQGGHGFRGLIQRGEASMSFEIVLTREQQRLARPKTGGRKGNVVSLSSRRKR